LLIFVPPSFVGVFCVFFFVFLLFFCVIFFFFNFPFHQSFDFALALSLSFLPKLRSTLFSSIFSHPSRWSAFQPPKPHLPQVNFVLLFSSPLPLPRVPVQILPWLFSVHCDLLCMDFIEDFLLLEHHTPHLAPLFFCPFPPSSRSTADSLWRVSGTGLFRREEEDESLPFVTSPRSWSLEVPTSLQHFQHQSSAATGLRLSLLSHFL